MYGRPDSCRVAPAVLERLSCSWLGGFQHAHKIGGILCGAVFGLGGHVAIWAHVLWERGLAECDHGHRSCDGRVVWNACNMVATFCVVWNAIQTAELNLFNLECSRVVWNACSQEPRATFYAVSCGTRAALAAVLCGV